MIFIVFWWNKVVCCLPINCSSHLCKNEASMPVKGLQVRRRKCFLSFLTSNQKRFHMAFILMLFLTAGKEWFLFICIDHPIVVVFLSEKGLCMLFSTKLWTHKSNNETNASSQFFTCYSRSLYLAKAFLKRQVNISWYNISLSLSRYHSAEVIMNAVVARWGHVCLM